MKSPADRLLDAVDWIPVDSKPDPNGKLPHITHCGQIHFGGDGIALRCYQLSNGQRVLDADDVRDLFGATYSGEFATLGDA